MNSYGLGLTTRRSFLAQATALPLLAQEDPTEAFRRTRQQAARGKLQPWFQEDGLGFFFCWGPCSVGEIEIGWGLFKDVGAPNKYWPPEKYIALADKFDPQNYDPDKWLAAAAKAGVKYTVFLVRHHDGYALWPSDYGHFGTKQHLKGRDLVRPFVDACRKNGIKVGFYYSPNDWLFNPKGWPYLGFPLRDPKFTYRRPEKSQGLPRYTDMPIPKIQEYFEILYAYCKGQVKELMTRYGKIDLLWWDGY
ncbi:MAG: alpha-L-fucosidase, partial [Bryobacteraceae bacterium]